VRSALHRGCAARLHRQHDPSRPQAQQRHHARGAAALIDFGLSWHDQLPDLLAEEIAGPIGISPYISRAFGPAPDPRSDLFSRRILGSSAPANARSAS
jgi:hypothetical protein